MIRALRLSLFGLLVIFYSCNRMITTNRNNRACEWKIVYDQKEYLNSGETNWIWGISGFDTTNMRCWDELAELYYNLAPDSITTKQQNSYFLLISKTDSQVYKLSDILNSPQVKFKVIGVHKYKVDADSLASTFIYYPFKVK